MAIANSPAHSPLMLPYQPMRVSVERYHELIERGFFTDNSAYELLEGVIVEKMTKHPAHVYATNKVRALIASLVSSDCHLRSQDPITLATSEPEPDLAVVSGTLEQFAAKHPSGRDVLLLVEVAESSLSTDRYKAGIYAAAGVEAYWIVNLPQRTVEVYTSPVQEGAVWRYTKTRIYPETEKIPVELGDKLVGTISAAALFPN